MTEERQEELEELTPVGDGVEEEQPQSEELEPKEDEREDDVETEEEDEDLDDEDDDEEDERLAAEGDEDDQTKKERRRLERKSRRQRQKEARDRDKRELQFLRNRNENLERRFSELDARVGKSEMHQVDAVINKKKADIKLADQVIAKAISSGDGEAYAEAQNIRDGLRDELSRLTHAKQSMGQQQQQQPAPNPRLIEHATAWMEDHDWWDPSGGDPDSRRVSQLDAALVNEGLDPTTQDYWDELSRRVEEALPHRFSNGAGSEQPQQQKKKKPASNKGPTFSTGGRERPLKKGEVYISPERRQAMEEAGVWDDPELRQKYLRAYAKYDTEASA